MNMEIDKDRVRKLLEDNEVKNFLQDNDIDGLYDYLVRADSETAAPRDIGALTWFLEKCGINTVIAIGNGKIPEYYCYNTEIPPSLIDGDSIKFPGHIKEIGRNSFCFAHTPKGVNYLDLRGIERIGYDAFFDLEYVEAIIIDDGLKKAGINGQNTFCMEFEKIIAPDSLTEEEVMDLFDLYDRSGSVSIEFY